MDYKEKVIALLNSQELSKEQKEKLESIFPELKESKDERTRKMLHAYIHDFGVPKEYFEDIEISDVLAWLEKQGELDNNDTNILNRFSFYSYKDEPNILYLSELYVNKEQRNKGIGTKILKIADKVAASMKCNLIRLKTEIGSNAERLYRKNGYNSLMMEGNQVWLEKQGEKKLSENAKTLDADKVIEWLNEYVANFWGSPCNPNRVVNQFKKDFGL